MGGMIGAMNSFGRDSSVINRRTRPGTAKRTLKYAGAHSLVLGLFLVVVVIEAGIVVLNPLIYREIINNGILRGNSSLSIHLAILAAILGLSDGALGMVQAYLSSRISARIVVTLRTQLFDHIQQMPLEFFTRAQTGALITRLNNDVNGARSAFTDILSNVVGNLITVALILIAMFALSWRITLAALVLLPLFVLPARFWGRKLQEIMREGYDRVSMMNNVMAERFNVAGALLAKLFGRSFEESALFRENATRVADIEIKQSIYGRLFFTVLLAMATCATALAYGWGGVLAIKHLLDVGTIVALVSYLSRLYGPLLGLSNVQVSIMGALVSFERIFEVLDLAPTIREKPEAVIVSSGPARILFDQVSFRYPVPAELPLGSLESIVVPGKGTGSTVLRNISFIVEPGHMVALVGPSGAGKTTIAQLVPRLYDIQAGSIRINGIDVRDARLESLRQRIGVVPQDVHFFNESIRKNLLYASPSATDEEIWNALNNAQISDLIESLPDKLDTLVGDRGYRFSGGEKQRIAIARLLLNGPDIVILDEATAHLDSESEAAVQRALESALAGRTSIIIAHRLSTIVKADEILVLQGGSIVERGAHAELLARSGMYADLYRRQFEKAEPVSLADL